MKSSALTSSQTLKAVEDQKWISKYKFIKTRLGQIAKKKLVGLVKRVNSLKFKQLISFQFPDKYYVHLDLSQN